jgi:hypothetical protein
MKYFIMFTTNSIILTKEAMENGAREERWRSDLSPNENQRPYVKIPKNKLTIEEKKRL